jgi:hypothetical protein
MRNPAMQLTVSILAGALLAGCRSTMKAPRRVAVAAALAVLALVVAATDIIMLMCSVAGTLVCLFRMAFLRA